MRQFLVLLAACGTSNIAPPPSPDAAVKADAPAGHDADTPGELEHHLSGTRIKVRVITTPDGAKAFKSMYDVQRGEDCAFRPAADGVTRCLPAVHQAFEQHYSDAGCTVPVVFMYVCQTPPKYLALISSQGCTASGGPKIYLRGAASTSAYLKAPSCIPTTFNAQHTYYALGAEVLPGSFVAGTSELE